MPKPPLLTVAQAAELRPDLPERSIRRWCQSGTLPAVRLSDLLGDRVPPEALYRDGWLIEPADLKRFVPPGQR